MSDTYGGSPQLTMDAMLKRPKLQGRRARKTYVGFKALYAKRKAKKRSSPEQASVTDSSPLNIELAQIG